jgi:tRNA (guanine37-N1)-methyltransferase
MRLDFVSIFPDYFAPLRLSLPGKAHRDGLVSVAVHDLRDWTHDRHRTVDDTPYGGGAGMVMRPEPWGEVFDALLADEVAGERITVVVPTPAGTPFKQAHARELAARDRLIFACGRYEGIDQRVIEHLSDRVEVREVSLGDYVLNGGEVAALAIAEAVIRLLPGFMGNAESLAEESHEGGLLEYPSYTKPASWRGRDVPAVLLSGDHGAIEAWRADRSRQRTIERRPDLLARHASAYDGSEELRVATPADAGEIYTLQRACWVEEQEANPGLTIPALVESLADVTAWLAQWTVLVLRREGRLIGAVRARLEPLPDDPHAPAPAPSADGRSQELVWNIGRLMVAPDLHHQGIGRRLLQQAEALAPEAATALVLFTGAGSERNLRIYRKAGYRPVPGAAPGMVLLAKVRRKGTVDASYAGR